MPPVAARRLPGIRFEAQPPLLDAVLPRMDIAVFAGFAAMGPLHRPVVLEDAIEFEAIFGPDAPLAWDAARGEAVRSHLGPAVRAFFRNGGTRCWVIRLAGDASTNFFPIPGLARATLTQGPAASSGLRLSPAFARATSPGSWSDTTRVGAAAVALPLECGTPRSLGDRLAVDVRSGVRGGVEPGDLLRLRAGSHVGFLPADELTPSLASPPSDRPWLTVTGRPIWFRSRPPAPAALDGLALNAVVYTASLRAESVSDDFARDGAAVLGWRSEGAHGASGLVSLDLRIDVEAAPEPGGLVSVDVGGEQLWVTVRDVGVVHDDATAGADVIRISGSGLWWLKEAGAAPPEPVTACDRVHLELWVRQSEARALRLGDLGLTGGHARYWANLPDDERRFAKAGVVPDEVAENPFADARGFPLAGAGAPAAIYLPLDLAPVPEQFLGPPLQPQSALERDGLAPFDASLFVDPELTTPLTASVSDTAEHVQFGAARPRPLRGIHAALGIEEATILAVPDAHHRGWTQAAVSPPAPPSESTPILRPEWWHFLSCNPPAPVPPAAEPRWGEFLRCGIRLIAAPAGLRRITAGAGGTFALAWDSEPGVTFVLEEARQPDFEATVVLYTGVEPRFTLYGRPDGIYYYRVRALIGADTSDWSPGLAVQVVTTSAWRVLDIADYDVATLLVAQRAALRLSAARGDLFAVLALPEHYREDEAVAHAALLKDANGPRVPVPRLRPLLPAPPTFPARPDPVSLPMGTGEARAFSFGAIYHPWLSGRESNEGGSGVTTHPPDGALAGLLASRAIRRGAWIAPANERLVGVVALSPPLARTRRRQLQDAQVNVVWQEPRGFVTLGADTLSDDADLVPIGVRRLLSLLRRLALREGATYVFEPHDAPFRRLVQRGFEGFLTRMFERGAFAGRTMDSSFQVVTSTSLNTPRSVDQGRFIVELRVAPSLPMTYLTVRLVQTGDRARVFEER
jgi:hypothetical protein